MSESSLPVPRLTVPSSGSATGNPRNKTSLKPGRSLMDWVKLGHSGADLAGTGGRLLDITPHELSKHNKPSDCWMALKGRVYNVTPYMEYHPGGEEELMRGGGTDATDLFNEVHKWVNFESLLQKCLIGRLIENKSFFLKPSFLPLGKGTKESNKSNVNQTLSSSKNSLTVPSLSITTNKDGSKRYVAKSPLTSPMTPSSLPNPKYDWFQTNSMVNIAIYTKWKYVAKEHVVIVKKGKEIKIVCYIQDMTYTVYLDFHKPVSETFDLKIGSGSGKVDVLLNKMETGMRWSSIGKALPGHGLYVKSKDKESEYIECSITKKAKVTHDTRLFIIEVPKYSLLPVPVGFHVYLRIPGKDLVKPYTPVTAKLNTAAEDEQGRYIYLFIKIYSDGAFTPLLDELALESQIEVSLPEGSFLRDRLLEGNDSPTDLLLLGAGTGITPMIKVMISALEKEKSIHLVLFNKTEEDIPWREDFENLVTDHPSLLKITHVLSKSSDTWPGIRGHIRKELLEKFLPAKDCEETAYLCVCGPNIFSKLAVNLFKELGYSNEQYHVFLG